MLLRFNIQGAIPPPSNPAEQAWLNDLRARLRILKARCVIINEGEDNEEISFVDYELCGHDEGLPCQKIERLEVRKLKVPTL